VRPANILRSIGVHEDETGCTYSAVQVEPFHWFCTKCGWAEREAPAITEHGTEAVLSKDFYRCPNTDQWVYRWSDERLVLGVPYSLANVHPDCLGCGTYSSEVPR